MGIIDLFSKRQKVLRGAVPDVYVYTDIPNKLRVQIVHIVRDALGEFTQYSGKSARDAYGFINDTLCREYGKFELTGRRETSDDAVFNFFLGTPDHEEALDFIELAFKLIDRVARYDEYRHNAKSKITPDEAIEELNERFKEHGIGYSYESGEIIKVDSLIVHAEVVKPALALLRDPRFATANEEFLRAHEHYRHGRNKEALSDSLKSFESVLKIICGIHRWAYKNNDTAKTLIEICLTNQLIPNYLQSQLSSLRALIESGVPTIRNKVGGHGQGETAITAENHLTSYALHLTASNIVFFTECSKAVT